MKKITALFALLVIACSCMAQGFRTPFSKLLEYELSSRAGVSAAPGTERIYFMRFYRPAVLPLREGIHSEKAEHIRQMAVYLFNMYVSTAAYRMDVPSRLTLNQVGVLDSFSFGAKNFKFSRASSFYSQNKAEIKNYLKGFFSKAPYPAYNAEDPKNDKRELAFARLLEKAPRVNGYPGYYMAATNTVRGEASARDKAQVAAWLAAARADGEKKVITYATNTLSLEDFDNRFARRTNAMQYTYRCVNDECEYCGYLFGKRICQPAQENAFKNWHFYTITARPVSGGYLTPASGSRFKLADGSSAARWQYHTASLVMTYRDGRYAVLVADSFLAGGQPVSLEKWLSYFKPGSAQFAVMPFYRNQTVEAALKTPEKRTGRNVVVGGKVHTPHPIEY